MDKAQRKAMVEQWKLRRPEMGVISIRCKATGEAFLGASMGSHPNKRLAALWEQYGEEGFEWSVLKILDYENPEDDHTAELEKLREQCLAEDEKAVKIWK